MAAKIILDLRPAGSRVLPGARRKREILVGREQVEKRDRSEEEEKRDRERASRKEI